MEKALNKDIPLYDDFRLFFHGDGGSEWEILPQNDYCSNILKLEPNSNECIDGLIKLRKGLKYYPSFYLTNIKFNLTDGKKVPLKLYISPHIDIKKCQAKNAETIIVEGVAIVGESIFKRLKYVVSCDQSGRDLYDINIIEINGVKEYHFAIPGPLEKLK